MKASLELHTLKLNELEHAAEVAPIADDDVCLAELRDVLVKQGYEDRLGIALLHKHFEMADGEVLLERCNERTRTLTMSPAPRSELGPNVMQTLWRFQGSKISAAQGCESFCPTDAKGKHMGYKDHYPDDDDISS